LLIKSVSNVAGTQPKAAMSKYQIAVQGSSAVNAHHDALGEFYFNSYFCFILNIYIYIYVMFEITLAIFFPLDLTLLLFLNLVVYTNANLIGYNYEQFKDGKPLICKY